MVELAYRFRPDEEALGIVEDVVQEYHQGCHSAQAVQNIVSGFAHYFLLA